MGCSKSERGCMKHPTTTRSPGVCSACLRERLSQLSDSSNRRTTTFGVVGGGAGYSFFSSSTAYSYDSSSGGASPARGRRHHRHASELMGSIALFFSVGGGGGGLKKSRSIAVVPRRSGLDGNFISRGGGVSQRDLGEGKSGKKKGGFWSKLLGNTGKRNKEVNKNFRESFRVSKF
ncbi:hypothetical protein PanWU01x14_289740 [Parasponia andersonii]|uniref:Avr9/Cf-9 rapidly elicited protein n=1 Tax=Parasponia andersonii TaxID=3476 RepID=A0A2P5AY56_PARAD|nr:hypothetical protein PanWU01x14_289740 [Parasponia andersonii]